MLCDSRSKQRVDYIWVPELMIDGQVQKAYTNVYHIVADKKVPPLVSLFLG